MQSRKEEQHTASYLDKKDTAGDDEKNSSDEARPIAGNEDAAQTAPPKNKGRMLPLFIFFCLLLCLGAALFALWRNEAASQAPSHASAAVNDEEIASLRRKKAELEALLQKDPCALRQSLGLAPAAPPPPPAAADNTPATPPSTGATASKAESVDKVENATVFIISIAGKGLSTGTGFFVTPDMVMTNAHVVGNAPSRVFVINRKLGKPVQAGVVSTKGGEGTGGADYALLRVSGPQAVHPLVLRDTPRRTEKVNAWGYPYAVSRSDPKYQALMRGQLDVAPELVFSDGVVSAIMDRTPPVIVHTAPLSQGNSGGPLTDDHGMVVGINTLISLDDESYRQTSFALPASDFINFLRQNGVAVTLSKP